MQKEARRTERPVRPTAPGRRPPRPSTRRSTSPTSRYYIILYYTILYYTILYYTILHYAILTMLYLLC